MSSSSKVSSASVISSTTKKQKKSIPGITESEMDGTANSEKSVDSVAALKKVKVEKSNSSSHNDNINGKKDKKRKREDDAEDNDKENDESANDEKSVKEESEVVSSSPSQVAKALDFLHSWCFAHESGDKSQWKFRKVLQVQLLRLGFDRILLPPSEFQNFLNYISNIRGLALLQTGTKCLELNIWAEKMKQYAQNTQNAMIQIQAETEVDEEIKAKEELWNNKQATNSSGADEIQQQNGASEMMTNDSATNEKKRPKKSSPVQSDSQRLSSYLRPPSNLHFSHSSACRCSSFTSSNISCATLSFGFCLEDISKIIRRAKKILKKLPLKDSDRTHLEKLEKKYLKRQTKIRRKVNEIEKKLSKQKTQANSENGKDKSDDDNKKEENSDNMKVEKKEESGKGKKTSKAEKKVREEAESDDE